MNRPQIVQETDLNKAEFKYWEGQQINSYHSKVQSFLIQQLGNSYAGFLASPEIKNTSSVRKVSWLVFPKGQK